MCLTQALREQRTQEKGWEWCRQVDPMIETMHSRFKSMSLCPKNQGMEAIEVRYPMSVFGIHM